MDIEKSNSQSIVGINKRDWDKMRIRNMHVDTNLIRCQKKFFPGAYDKKLLDLGFGEGQNLMYFLSQGFECSGTEIAKSRLQFLKDTLRKHKRKADLRLVDSNILPFGDNYFDVVVAWESLYYNNEEGVKKALDEIARVLKPTGRFLSSIISTNHHGSVFYDRFNITPKKRGATAASGCTGFGYERMLYAIVAQKGINFSSPYYKKLLRA